MKVKFTGLIIGLSILGVFYSSTLAADSGEQAYLGIHYATADYKDDRISGPIDLTAAIFRFVKIYDNGLGFEGRMGFGLSEGGDTVDPALGSAELEIDVNAILGPYMVAQTSLSKTASIYGIMGFSSVFLDATLGSPSSDDSENESGLSYGFGVNFGKQNSVKYNLEYMLYLDKDDFEVSAISLGVLF